MSIYMVSVVLLVILSVNYSSIYGYTLQNDDYDFWDWARGTDSSTLSLKAHCFVTWK